MSEKILRVGPLATNIEGWSSEEVARFKEIAEFAFRNWDDVPQTQAEKWESELRIHISIASGVLWRYGVHDWKNYDAEFYRQVPSAIRDALDHGRQVCSHAQLLCQARTQDARIYHAMRIGYHSGLLQAALSSVSRNKVVVNKQWCRLIEMHERRLALTEYVEKRGYIPPIGEPGKQNAARTKFRQKFFDESGYKVDNKTFDEDLRVICGESR